MSSETKPLLSSAEAGSSVGGGGSIQGLPTTVPPIQGDPPPYSFEEPVIPAPYDPSGSAVGSPPPYTPSPSADGSIGGGQSLFVQCRVCQHVIHVAPGTQTRVVKCSNCREATPIAPPPPGKKYVRCPCNCLLTCSATASRVVCPRENCKRTIGVGTIDIRPTNTDRIRVVCGKCSRSILWPSDAAVARCPHCRSRSYLYLSWMRYRAIACAVVGILFVLIASALTAGIYAWASEHGGIYVVWVGLYVVGALMMLRAALYCCMTQSHRER